MNHYDAGAGTEQDVCVMSLLDGFEKLLKGRQLELFQLLRQGATLRQAAHIMGIGIGTLKRYEFRMKENIRKRCNTYNLHHSSLADWIKDDNPSLLI